MQFGLALPSARPQQAVLNGLVAAKPLSTLLAEDRASADASATKAREQASTPVVIGLVDQIKKHWSLAKEAKLPVEKEMLSAVRSRRGEYDHEKLARIKEQGGSEIYMMLFATKARQLKALLSDILVASGADKPWSMEPTPMPDIPGAVRNQIMQAVYEETLQAEMAGVPMSVEQVRQRLVDMKAQVEMRAAEMARAEAERAERIIEDDLVEGGFLEALDQFLDDLCVFKTAFIKGPVITMENELRWEEDPAGGTKAVVTQVKKRSWKRVDPFMIYPSPWTGHVNEGFLIERHKLTRGALSSMIGVDGYSEDAIRAVLDEHGRGGLHEWLSIDVEKASAEGRDGLAANTNRSETIDAIQYWGSVSGKMLREWGMSAAEVPDEAKEYEVEAWLIGSWAIKVVLNPDPLGRRGYYADGFSRIPGAFWHNSLYDVIRDCQDMCNAAARALSNNLGIASGPQVYILNDRLATGEQVTEMYPWKIWQMVSDPAGTVADPIKFFQPSSHAQELMGVFEKFSQLADEYSGIPKYMAGMAGGEGGAGRTASGMSMMITNASKQIKQTITSIDLRILQPVVEGDFQHTLMNRPELGLSGDVKVRARGAASLIAKEAAQVRLNEFLTATNNPTDMQIVGFDGRAELLRSAVKRLDLPNPTKVVPSATEVLRRATIAQMQQMQQAQAQQQKPDGNGQELMDGSPVTDAFQPT